LLVEDLSFSIAFISRTINYSLSLIIRKNETRRTRLQIIFLFHNKFLVLLFILFVNIFSTVTE